MICENTYQDNSLFWLCLLLGVGGTMWREDFAFWNKIEPIEDEE